MRSLLARATLVVVMIARAMTLSPLLVAGQAGEAVKVAKQIVPINPDLDGEVTVSLTLSGSNAMCDPELVTDMPLDVVLVIDHSGSMENIIDDIVCLFLGCKSKLQNAKEAASALMDELNPIAGRVAVVQFGSTAELQQPLTSNYDSVKRIINSISSTLEGTSLHLGLERAHQELVGEYRNPDAASILIMLSDGESNYGQAVTSAEAAKADGIRVISVGIGDDINSELMIDIASTPEDYYFSPTSSDLQEIYLSIAQQIRRAIGATNIRIEHRFDTTKIEVVPGSIFHGGVLTEPGTIVWSIATLHNRSQTLSYRAQVRAYGSFLADVGDDITYIFCEDQPRSFHVEPALNLQVPTPTPTPTPSVTPTPIPTPTPTPTSTPTVTPTPTATPTPKPTPTPLPGSLNPFEPNTRWLWWPWLLLILLLALLIAWLLWRRRRPSTAVTRPVRRTGRPAPPSRKPVERPKKRDEGKDVTHGRKKK